MDSPALQRIVAAARRLESESVVLALAGNPYHIKSGPDGGRFTFKDGSAAPRDLAMEPDVKIKGKSGRRLTLDTPTGEHRVIVNSSIARRTPGGFSKVATVKYRGEPFDIYHSPSASPGYQYAAGEGEADQLPGSMKIGTRQLTLKDGVYQTVLASKGGAVGMALHGDPQQLGKHSEAISTIMSGIENEDYGTLSTVHIVTGRDAQRASTAGHAYAAARVLPGWRVANVFLISDPARLRKDAAAEGAADRGFHSDSFYRDPVRHTALHELAHVHDGTKAAKSGVLLHSTVQGIPSMSTYAMRNAHENYAEAKADWQLTPVHDNIRLNEVAAQLGWAKAAP